MLVKSADDKTKRLQLLEELGKSDRLDEQQKDWLREELWRLRPGIAGERDAAHYLDLSFSDGKNRAVLHDLRLMADDQVAQIDHLVIDRTLTFFLLETKNYNGSMYINEHGEFMVEYAGERRYGIESPLEQSRRHETVLNKVLERLEITGRGGTKPTFVHVVMMHPKAIIHRPDAKKFDTSMVIKADQFATWHKNYVDKCNGAQVLADLINVRGRDTVKEWGDMLKRQHCPTNPLELPKFMKPRDLAPVSKSRAASATSKAPTATRVVVDATLSAPVCATCGKRLTPKVEQYCLDNAKRFGGKLYCIPDQAAFKLG